MKKNVASQVIGAQMVDKDAGTAFTGTVTCYVTGDGGTQGLGSVGSGVCAHEGQGLHTYAPAQAETNYDHIAFTFTAASAVPVSIQVYTEFPQTGDSFARIGALGAGLTAIWDNTTANALVSNVTTILSDTNDIQTRIPAALIGGRIDANVGAISASTASVARMVRALETEVLGECTAGATVSTIPVASFAPASSVNDQFVGLVIKFDMNTTTTALRGQASIVTDFVHATQVLTVTDLTTAPADGDTFVLL